MAQIWNPTQQYFLNNTVQYSTTLYIAINDGTLINIGFVPGASGSELYWALQSNPDIPVVNSLNTQNGNLTLANGGGIGIDTIGAVITLTNLNSQGVASVNGKFGTIGVLAGTGITVATTTASVAPTGRITVNNDGVITLNGAKGAVTVAVNGGLGVATVGNTVTLNNTGVLSAIGSGGIGVSGATGDVTFTNTGVLSAIGTTGIGVSGTTGNVTFSNAGVLSVTAGGTKSTGDLNLLGTSGQIVVSNTAGNVTLSNPGVLKVNAGGYDSTGNIILTAGTNTTITNNAGNITINSTGGGGGGGSASGPSGAIQISDGAGGFTNKNVFSIDASGARLITPINLATYYSNAPNLGYLAGQTAQGDGGIAIGASAGNNTQGTNAIAIGLTAGRTNQYIDSIAIGRRAAYINQGQAGTTSAISIGADSGRSQGGGCIAIGNAAGDTQTYKAIAIGDGAGAYQAQYNIAIGVNSGALQQSTDSIAIGQGAGGHQFQALGDSHADNIAIGRYAGVSQEDNCIAIGQQAGNDQKGASIAIGLQAGFNQVDGAGRSIQIGAQTAGRVTTMKEGSIMIGTNAGAYASNNTTTISANSIVLDASDTQSIVMTTGAIAGPGFYVKPIRYEPTTDAYFSLFYDATTGEIVYG